MSPHHAALNIEGRDKAGLHIAPGGTKYDEVHCAVSIEIADPQIPDVPIVGQQYRGNLDHTPDLRRAIHNISGLLRLGSVKLAAGT